MSKDEILYSEGWCFRKRKINGSGPYWYAHKRQGKKVLCRYVGRFMSPDTLRLLKLDKTFEAARKGRLRAARKPESVTVGPVARRKIKLGKALARKEKAR